MTSGFSSDATDDAIQANIVAAGYGPGATNGNGCGPKCTKATTCAPSLVPSGLTTLTDFSSNLDSGGVFHTGGVNDWTSLFGGTWIAPTAPVATPDASADPCAPTTAPPQYPLAQSFTDGNWHITTCTPASLMVGNITQTPQTVRVLWSDLTNGMPVATPNPSEITGIAFGPTLDFSGSASAYTLDLVIDDLMLVP